LIEEKEDEPINWTKFLERARIDLRDLDIAKKNKMTPWRLKYYTSELHDLNSIYGRLSVRLGEPPIGIKSEIDGILAKFEDTLNPPSFGERIARLLQGWRTLVRGGHQAEVRFHASLVVPALAFCLSLAPLFKRTAIFALIQVKMSDAPSLKSPGVPVMILAVLVGMTGMIVGTVWLYYWIKRKNHNLHLPGDLYKRQPKEETANSQPSNSSVSGARQKEANKEETRNSRPSNSWVSSAQQSEADKELGALRRFLGWILWQEEAPGDSASREREKLRKLVDWRTPVPEAQPNGNRGRRRPIEGFGVIAFVSVFSGLSIVAAPIVRSLEQTYTKATQSPAMINIHVVGHHFDPFKSTTWELAALFVVGGLVAKMGLPYTRQWVSNGIFSDKYVRELLGGLLGRAATLGFVVSILGASIMALFVTFPAVSAMVLVVVGVVRFFKPEVDNQSPPRGPLQNFLHRDA